MDEMVRGGGLPYAFNKKGNKEKVWVHTLEDYPKEETFYVFIILVFAPFAC